MRHWYTRIVAILCAVLMLVTASVSPGDARSEGDLNRLRADVMTALQQARPGENFRPDPKDPARILSDRITVDVTNLYNQVTAFPDDPTAPIIEDFVAGMLASMEQPEAIRVEELVTVLRSAGYIEYLETRGTPYISRPVTGGLHAILMRDTPRAYQTVGPDAFPDKSAEALLEIGTGNAARFLPDLASEPYDDFALYYIGGETNLTNALALMPEFWATVSARFGEDFVFVMPRRDQLFVFGGRSEDVLVKAVTMIDVTFADQFNLLSSEVYAIENGQIVPVWTPQQGVLPRL